MTLAPISQAVVNAITASGVVPFRQYHAVEARTQPRLPAAGEPMGAVIYFHGGGFFAGSLDDTDLLVRHHYLPDPADREDWRASPILARSFAGLPPALIVTASHDPLVDEGKAFADRLGEAGVPVEYACSDGTIHGFVSMAGVIPAGARAMALICERIKAVTHVAIVAPSSPDAEVRN